MAPDPGTAQALGPAGHDASQGTPRHVPSLTGAVEAAVSSNGEGEHGVGRLRCAPVAVADHDVLEPARGRGEERLGPMRNSGIEQASTVGKPIIQISFAPSGIASIGKRDFSPRLDRAPNGRRPSRRPTAALKGRGCPCAPSVRHAGTICGCWMKLWTKSNLPDSFQHERPARRHSIFETVSPVPFREDAQLDACVELLQLAASSDSAAGHGSVAVRARGRGRRGVPCRTRIGLAVLGGLPCSP